MISHGLNLHPDTFHDQTTQAVGGRHLGTTVSISPRHLGTTTCKLTDPFSFIADHDEQFCTLLNRCQSVGTGNKSKVGLTWLLSGGEEFPGVSNLTGTTEHPLPDRDKGWCMKTPAGHGIPFDNTKPCCQVWKGLWSHCSEGTYPPSLLLCSEGCSLQTCATGRWKCGLAICLCMAKWCHIPCTHIEWRTYQHHDRWCTQHRCLWLASPTADMQAIVAWGHGGMPGRFKWWAARSLQFAFLELPLWDAATPSEFFWEPQLLEVDLGSAQPQSMTTTIQAPTNTPVLTHSLANTVELPCDVVAINLHFQGPWNSCSGPPPQP